MSPPAGPRAWTPALRQPKAPVLHPSGGTCPHGKHSVIQCSLPYSKLSQVGL